MVPLRGRVFIVDTREYGQRHLEEYRAERESSKLHESSRLVLAMREPGLCERGRQRACGQKRRDSRNTRVIRRKHSLWEEARELLKFGVGQEVRRARMLALTMKCVAGTCDTEGGCRSACFLVC